MAPHNRDRPFHAGYGRRQSLRELMDHRKLDITRGYYSVGEVAVSFGICAGCDHFRTDICYLPDLTAYLPTYLPT